MPYRFIQIHFNFNARYQLASPNHNILNYRWLHAPPSIRLRRLKHMPIHLHIPVISMSILILDEDSGVLQGICRARVVLASG